MKELVERINDLEGQLAFQDDTIQALNQAIVKQQQIIDLLEQKIRLLIKGHNELLERYSEIEDNIPPPHY